MLDTIGGQSGDSRPPPIVILQPKKEPEGKTLFEKLFPEKEVKGELFPGGDVKVWSNESLMKTKDWDDMTAPQQNSLIALWKEKHPGWKDRKTIYQNLSKNAYGTEWRYINNIIASTAPIVICPRPGVSLKSDEDAFYDDYYPRAAAILMWASFYGVTLTAHPVWYNRVYVTNIPQAAILEKNELIGDIDDGLKENKWSLMGFGLAAVAIITVVLKVL